MQPAPAMLTATQLQDLAAFRSPAAAVLSLYIDADPREGGAALARRAQALARREGLLDREDLERVERYFDEEYEPGAARCLAIFSARRFGLWRVCRLPQPVRTRLTLADRPAISSLVSVADQYQRFGVLLASRQRARFLEVFMGESLEHHALGATAEEAAAAAGGGLHPYLRFLGDRLDGLSRQQSCDRVIVGAAADIASDLVNHLSSPLQQSLILDSELHPATSETEALERILACERAARKVKEAVLVHRLLDSAQTSRLAVTGLERTLDAFRKGQVKVLLVRHGFTKMGRACPKCGGLSLDWPKCLDCRVSTRAVFDLVGEMVEQAFERRCGIFRVFSETPLDNVGHIGAHLSHANVEQAPRLAATAATAAPPAPIGPAMPAPTPA